MKITQMMHKQFHPFICYWSACVKSGKYAVMHMSCICHVYVM